MYNMQRTKTTRGILPVESGRAKARAYAKINLVLDVLRRREDGYHEVRMVMQTVSLYDDLELSVLPGKDVVECESNLPYLPRDGRNLAVRAAELIRTEYGIRDGISIRIRKRIPVAAGLAGGSSDAAAVLRACSELFSLGLTGEKMRELGLRLGADVPFCVAGGTALSEGIGEILTPVEPMPDCGIVLLKPPFGVSTKQVYEGLHLDENTAHPDVSAMLSALQRKDLEGILEVMGNLLEGVTAACHPEIGQLEAQLDGLGARRAMMSGSGPTVFGVFDRYEDAVRAKEQFRTEHPGIRAYAVRPERTGMERFWKE